MDGNVPLPGENLANVWSVLNRPQRRQALIDLCRRVTAVPHTHLAELPQLPPSPMYALQRDLAQRNLDAHAGAFDSETLGRLRSILDEGFDAMKLVPRGLVHTDTGPHNAVWDGHAAVPVDFEFATIGPIDLDVDGLCRSAAGWDPSLLTTVVGQLHDTLHIPGASARLGAYAVLRDLWGLGTWVANSPERQGMERWQPALDLGAHALGTSWVYEVVEAAP